MTVFLDTVGLIALWDEDDQWHSPAKESFSQLLFPMSVQDETKLRSPTRWGDGSLDIFSDVAGRDAHFAKCGSTLPRLSTRQPRQRAPEGVGPLGHGVKPLPFHDESSRLQFPQMPQQRMGRNPGDHFQLRQGPGFRVQGAVNLNPPRMGEGRRQLVERLDRMGLALERSSQGGTQSGRGLSARAQRGSVFHPATRAADFEQPSGFQRPQGLAGQGQRLFQAQGHRGDAQGRVLVEQAEHLQARPIGQHTAGAPERRGRGSRHGAYFAKCAFFGQASPVLPAWFRRGGWAAD